LACRGIAPNASRVFNKVAPGYRIKSSAWVTNFRQHTTVNDITSKALLLEKYRPGRNGLTRRRVAPSLSRGLFREATGAQDEQANERCAQPG
jgi:hypothetical protein